MCPNRHRHDRGFTLVELLIVVAVIGVIATIAIPGYLRFTARAHRSELMETVSKIKLHFKNVYDNTGTFAGAATPGIGTASAVNPTAAGVPVGQPAPWDNTASGWTDFQFPPDGSSRLRYSYTITAPDSMTIMVCGSFSALGPPPSGFSCATGNGGGTANYQYLEVFNGNGTSSIQETPSF